MYPYPDLNLEKAIEQVDPATVDVARYDSVTSYPYSRIHIWARLTPNDIFRHYDVEVAGLTPDELFRHYDVTPEEAYRNNDVEVIRVSPEELGWEGSESGRFKIGPSRMCVTDNWEPSSPRFSPWVEISAALYREIIIQGIAIKKAMVAHFDEIQAAERSGA